MVWAANMAAIEIHAPMALAADLENPRIARVRLRSRARRPRSWSAVPSPSGSATCWRRWGSKAGARRRARRACRCTSRSTPPGVTHDATADFALAVGQVMERQMPGKVTTVMAKVERPGKIFVDWSQNAHHKTTIAPVLASCSTRPDGVDPGDVGRGRRLRFERGRIAIRSGRRAGARRGVRRPFRAGPDHRAGTAPTVRVRCGAAPHGDRPRSRVEAPAAADERVCR